MIYILTFYIIIVFFTILYYRNKNKKKKKEYITNFLFKINNFLDNKKEEKIKQEEAKLNIINDMGDIIPYSMDNHFSINNKHYNIPISNSDYDYVQK